MYVVFIYKEENKCFFPTTVFYQRVDKEIRPIRKNCECLRIFKKHLSEGEFSLPTFSV